VIFGVGIDLQDVPQMAQALKRQGPRLIARMSHPADRRGAPPRTANAARQAQYWAGRWAAKEAFAKALGTGIGATVSLTDVGVKKGRGGRPELTYSKKLAGYMKRQRIISAHISITHTSSNAAAVVILVRK
jgi:holo-[acyl-carrier protein] synthase